MRIINGGAANKRAPLVGRDNMQPVTNTEILLDEIRKLLEKILKELQKEEKNDRPRKAKKTASS